MADNPYADRKTFADFARDAANWVTLASGEYYPDILEPACALYAPVLVMFGQLLKSSESSVRLYRQISEIKSQWMRIQLTRVFRKYVSPETPVEMLKKKNQALSICDKFGSRFRPIPEVQSAFNSRPVSDEAICALLWEYKDRGKKGYDLTERFFETVHACFPDLRIIGPERAGRDVLMGEIFERYPRPKRPVDFVIYGQDDEVLAIGLARYDSDRGGAQEDDRTGGYVSCADELLGYARERGLRTKVIFLNDGPGLLLGTMWHDYADLEKRWPGKILVLTLRMVPYRLTLDWLLAN